MEQFIQEVVDTIPAIHDRNIQVKWHAIIRNNDHDGISCAAANFNPLNGSCRISETGEVPSENYERRLPLILNMLDRESDADPFST